MARMDYLKIAPDAVKAMMSLEEYINKSSLEKNLIDLIKLRASQINGCHYCITLHTANLRKLGESEPRLEALSTWRESSLFTKREQAALAWTEAVTLLPETHAPDEVYQEVSSNFTEKEIVDITMAIIAINGWNRLAVSFRK